MHRIILTIILVFIALDANGSSAASTSTTAAKATSSSSQSSEVKHRRESNSQADSIAYVQRELGAYVDNSARYTLAQRQDLFQEYLMVDTHDRIRVLQNLLELLPRPCQKIIPNYNQVRRILNDLSNKATSNSRALTNAKIDEKILPVVQNIVDTNWQELAEVAETFLWASNDSVAEREDYINHEIEKHPKQTIDEINAALGKIPDWFKSSIVYYDSYLADWKELKSAVEKRKKVDGGLLFKGTILMSDIAQKLAELVTLFPKPQQIVNLTQPPGGEALSGPLEVQKSSTSSASASAVTPAASSSALSSFVSSASISTPTKVKTQPPMGPTMSVPLEEETPRVMTFPRDLNANISLARVKKFIEEEGSPDAREEQNKMPLLSVALGKRYRRRVIEYLINEGANVEILDSEQHTPLMNAAMYGHSTAVPILVKKGAKVNAQTARGRTPLMLAIHRAQEPERVVETIVALLENGADINIKDNGGSTVFDYAKEKGYSQMLADAIENQRRNRNKQRESDSAMSSAAQKSSTSTASVSVPAKTYIQPPMGPAVSIALEEESEENIISAFFDAVRKGQTGLIDAIAQRGFDVNTQLQDGSTALMEIISNPEDPQNIASTVYSLLKHGAIMGRAYVNKQGKSFSDMVQGHKYEAEIRKGISKFYKEQEK